MRLIEKISRRVRGHESENRRAGPRSRRASEQTRARMVETGAWVPARGRALGTTLVLVCVLVLALGAGAVSGAPPGMVGVPSDQISSNVPAHAQAKIPSDADEGIYASSNASTTEIEITTPSRAQGANQVPIEVGEEDLVLEISDSENHEGREIGIPVETVESLIGHRPARVWGYHESGDRWVSEVEYEDGYALAEIPKFSSNTVTFGGTVSLSAQQATESTSWSYELESVDSVDNFSVDLTGEEVTDSRFQSWNTESRSTSLDIGGTSAPENVTASLTAVKTGNNRTETGSVDATSTSIPIEQKGNSDPTNAEIEINTSGVSESFSDDYIVANQNLVQGSNNELEFVGDRQEVALDVSNMNKINNVTVGFHAGGGAYGELTANISGQSIGTHSIDEDGGHYQTLSETGMNIDVSDKSSVILSMELTGNAEVPIDGISGKGYGDFGPTTLRESGAESIDVTDSSSTKSVGTAGPSSLDIGHSTSSLGVSVPQGDVSYTLDYTEINITTDPSISVDGSTAESYTGTMSEGQTVSSSTSLSTGSNSISISSKYPVKANLSYVAVSQSVDPTVTVNNDSDGYSGTLSEGKNVSLSPSSSWVENGTNTVDISLGSANGGPAPQVGVEYTHDADVIESASISSGTWRESAQVNRTWVSDRDSVSMRVPMPSNVVQVGGAEIQRNGTGWSDVSSSNLSLNGTDLVVDVGSVSEAESIDIRANGSKIQETEGDIKVTEPTIEGNKLDTRIRVDSQGTDGLVEIDVSETVRGDSLQYVDSADWIADERAHFSADGTQKLQMRDSTVGAKANISEHPMDVSPEMGEVLVSLENSSETRFTLEPGESKGDIVEIVYRDTESGVTYQLYDVDNNRVVDEETANSPVSFTTDDSGTYVIRTSSGSGSGSLSAGVTTGSSSPIPLALLSVGLLGVLGSALVARRFGLGRLPVLLVSGVAILGIAELATPNSLLGTISSDLLFGSSQPLVSIVAGTGILLGLVYLQWRTDREIPAPLLIAVGFGTSIWMVESIAPGLLTRPLREGLADISSLVWLALIGGSIYLIYGWIQSRNAPDTEVTFDLEGGN